MRVFQVCLLCLALFVQYRLWFGQNGVQDYSRLRKKLNSNSISNQQINHEVTQ